MDEKKGTSSRQELLEQYKEAVFTKAARFVELHELCEILKEGMELYEQVKADYDAQDAECNRLYKVLTEEA